MPGTAALPTSSLLEILVCLVPLLMLAPVAAGQPFSATDRQYLAALNHGGLCCPQQADTPVWYESPALAVNTGKQIAEAMASNPTYQQFNLMKGWMYESSRNRGVHPLNAFESGQIVVIAVHYSPDPRSSAN
jgi:hypothetical protein